MPPANLVMLSSYRMPTHHPLMLGPEDTAAWLNAWRLLWHPSLLRGAMSLPAIADPSDHSQPQSATLYTVPASPAAYLPENWQDLVRHVGAVAVNATSDWRESLENLRTALAQLDEPIILDDDANSPCYALGFGYAVIETLFEAMEHERLLDPAAFLTELQGAAEGNGEQATAAALRLVAHRDILYLARIHLIDLALAGFWPLPSAARCDFPLSVVGSAADLEKLTPNDRQRVRDGLEKGTIELCGGHDLDRPDAELPLESQLWNLRRGRRRAQEIVGQAPTIYARTSAGFHPYVPNWIAEIELANVLYTAFDGSAVPHYKASSVRWPAPDGRQVNALARTPQPADDPQTYFHLAHHLYQTVMQDSAAVMLFRHGERPAALWHDDLLTLSKLAPVLGDWTTVGQYLDQGAVGDYASAASPDDFAPETLDALATSNAVDPISRFARHYRLRRRLDAARTHLALLQSLDTTVDAALLHRLDECENTLESQLGNEPDKLAAAENEAERLLAARLVAKVTGTAGWLVLNPCPFTRRVGLERADWPGCPPVEGPVKAAQRDGELVRLVVEIPGLGFAWIPNAVTEPPDAKMTLAHGTTVRNEFFEAEIDPETGGLRAFRDPRDRVNRIGQQLVWQPGATMRADEVRITACGPALGEITATGALLDEHDNRFASFVQRFRAWQGRPLLELHVELRPEKPPNGAPWHAYYAARFAGRDERAALHRGIYGQSSVTTHHRPGSPEFIEFRSGKSSVLVLTGGLPFAQRHAQRMIDVLLITAGETATTFNFAIGLDRGQPAQSAQGFVSPVAVVPVENGPPAVGPTGWLAHLSTAHVLMTSLRPVPNASAVLARLFEVGATGGHAELRWARDPVSAAIVNGDGLLQMDAMIEGDAAGFEVMAHDLVRLRVDW